MNNNLERFVQDDGQTMRNRLGISRDPEAFEAALSKYTGFRIAELQLNPDLVEQTFDRKHLSALHKHITQDVFEWAGKMRDESVVIEGEKIGPVKTMAKPGGAQFDDQSKLKAGFVQLEKMTDVDKARKMDHKTFSRHAAEIFTHLNWMHPFREGNGRVQREFIRQYAETSGHKLDFRYVTQGRMYEVSEHSNRQHFGHMTRLFEEIGDPAAVERMRGPYQAFGKREGFQQLYFAHACPGRPVKGSFVGKGKGEFVVQDDKTADITIAAIADMPEGLSSGDPVNFVPRTPFQGHARTSEQKPARESTQNLEA
jgi:cell filamentation protein